MRASAQEPPAAPVRGKDGASILGPSNPTREAQSRDRLAPPVTDHGTLPNLRFSFADTHNRPQPGGMRELHWHPNSDELQYYLEGRSRMTVYASGSAAGTFDYQLGDVGYVPRSMPHSIENTGDARLRYLEVWKSPWFSDVSLRQWLAFTPYELVRAHLNIDRSLLAPIPVHKTPVLPGFRRPLDRPAP
jgi:mannose-6-phosphate isomerase-like protein (cupin superfamily)